MEIYRKMNGYIKLFRKMLDWEWMDDPVTVQVFVYCLLRANFETQRWHGEVLKPGQFVTSYAHMAKDLGITKSQLRTALKHLKLTQEITQSVTQHATLITIANWGLYQSAGEKVAQSLTQHVTSQSHFDDISIATDKEREEIKKEKKERYIERDQIMNNASQSFAPFKQELMEGVNA